MSKYFLVMEDINITIGGLGLQNHTGNLGLPTPSSNNTLSVVMFRKGDIGEVVGESAKNGYFLAKHLDSDTVHDIPYAPAFIKFVGDDLETIRTLYENEEKEADFDL